ncbi:MAG: DUF2244 domain-containing protein [Bauldia sp.]|nr:DUF2244 domain-containing protein [Bauldia sp.]
MPAPSRVPDISPEPLLFSATLIPYRSLSQRGFFLLMLAIGVVSFGLGVAFVTMGAWPVFGFFGLDATLIYLAFRRNYRDARAFEEITLSGNRLLVRSVSADGDVVEHSFAPAWTRLETAERPGGWGIAGLALVSSDRRLVIGRFLNAADRTAFAEVFARALADARSGPR